MTTSSGRTSKPLAWASKYEVPAASWKCSSRRIRFHSPPRRPIWRGKEGEWGVGGGWGCGMTISVYSCYKLLFIHLSLPVGEWRSLSGEQSWVCRCSHWHRELPCPLWQLHQKMLFHQPVWGERLHYQLKSSPDNLIYICLIYVIVLSPYWMDYWPLTL
jgi:hypothetical protein